MRRWGSYGGWLVPQRAHGTGQALVIQDGGAAEGPARSLSTSSVPATRPSYRSPPTAAMPSLHRLRAPPTGFYRTTITSGRGHRPMSPPPGRRTWARLIRAGRAGGGEREGRVMTGWLRRSREPGARVVRNPARPAAGRIARGGTGAVAAAGMLSGFWRSE